MYSTILHVIRFEFQRSLTSGRILTWLLLCLFPMLLVGMLQWQSDGNLPEFALVMACYTLVPQIGCMLGLLMWASPAIGSEIESQGWIYLTLRSRGRVSVAVGKYVLAYLWCASYGIVSACGVTMLSQHDEPVRLAAALIALVLLSSASYAALYLAIGALAFRRATVVAVVYSLLLEGLISWIPATVNQLTVSYRLRALLIGWLTPDMSQLPEDALLVFGTEPIWFNIACLFIFTAVCMFIALLTIHQREYPVQAEA